jgi:mRNA interferase RelE/StbE
MYRLLTTPAARRDMAKLERRLFHEERERLRAAIRNLAVEPRPTRAKKLKARQFCYRLRVGDYRVVYEVRDRDSTVRIIRIGRRNESTYVF